MDLFLIRHAAAVPAGPDLLDDARPLTDRGRLRFRRCMRGLRAVAPPFTLLLHSPLLRAVETANLASRHLVGPSRVTTALVGDPTAALFDELDGESVAVVGHSPWLDQLAAWLITGDPAGSAAFPFRKGGVLWLTGTPRPGAMAVVAALPPRILTRLA